MFPLVIICEHNTRVRHHALPWTSKHHVECSSFSNHTRERIHGVLNPGPLCLQLRLVALFKFLMKAKRLQHISKNHIEDDTVITAECLPCTRYSAHVSACIIPCDHPRKPEARAPCLHFTQEGLEAQQDSLPYAPCRLPRIPFAAKPLLSHCINTNMAFQVQAHRLAGPSLFLFSNTHPMGKWVLLPGNS